MSEQEKEIGRKIAENIPKLSKENQKYVLGLTEGMAYAKESKEVDSLAEREDLKTG